MEQSAVCFVTDYKPSEGKGKRHFKENGPCVRAQKHPGTVSPLLLPEVDFFLSFRNHRSSPSIARSQQLARLHVSRPTIWISQALAWQEWQCLHRGSSARAVNLIGSYYHQVSLLSFTPCWSSSSQPQQPCFLVDLLNGYFLLAQSQSWPDPATSSILMQSLQPDRSNFAVAGFPSPEEHEDTANRPTDSKWCHWALTVYW